jgi:hypothetical protein
MATVAGSTIVWFWRKGWIGNRDFDVNLDQDEDP